MTTNTIKRAFLAIAIARVKARRETGDAANAVLSAEDQALILAAETLGLSDEELGQMLKAFQASAMENHMSMLLLRSPIKEDWMEVAKEIGI